jgi:outer membrane receptor protein involved in Fe transport
MTGLSTGGNGNIPNYERLFYDNVRTMAQGPGQANEHWADVYTLPPLQMRKLYWDPVEPNPAPGGTLTVSDHPNTSVTDTRDVSSKGLEFEGIYNPTKNWTFTFNVARQQSMQTNIRPAQLRYLAVREPQWRAMANLVAQNGVTVGNYAFNTIAKAIRDAAALDGAINPEVRKWRANLVTRYTFDGESWLRHVAIGGGYRWQSKSAIGFERLPGSAINDVTKPLYGPEAYDADFFVNRTQSLFHGKVKWKIQLNIRNLTNKDDLIPIAKDFDGSVVSLMVPNPRTFELTNTFQF